MSRYRALHLYGIKSFSAFIVRLRPWTSARKPMWGPSTRASFGMPISCRAYWLSPRTADPWLWLSRSLSDKGWMRRIVVDVERARNGRSFKRKHCPICLAFCTAFACHISLLYCVSCYWCQPHEFWHGNAWRWQLFCIRNVTFTSFSWKPPSQINTEVKRTSCSMTHQKLSQRQPIVKASSNAENVADANGKLNNKFIIK